jgi:hypothetical protein
VEVARLVGFGFGAVVLARAPAAGFAAAFAFAPVRVPLLDLARAFAPAARAFVFALAPPAVRALVFGCAAFGRRAGEVSAGPAEADAAVAPAPLAPPAAAPRAPARRLSLRTPGRDLGRLPSTPGSSLRSAATPEK